MNSNDSNKNKFKPWWAEFNFEFSMLILIRLFSIGLSIMAALIPGETLATALMKAGFAR